MNCIECGIEIKGRADKKFCGPTCRSKHWAKTKPAALPQADPKTVKAVQEWKKDLVEHKSPPQPEPPKPLPTDHLNVWGKPVSNYFGQQQADEEKDPAVEAQLAIDSYLKRIPDLMYEPEFRAFADDVKNDHRLTARMKEDIMIKMRTANL